MDRRALLVCPMLVLACCATGCTGGLADAESQTEDEMAVWVTVLQVQEPTTFAPNLERGPRLLFDHTQTGAHGLRHEPPTLGSRKSGALVAFGEAGSQALADYAERNREQVPLSPTLVDLLAGGERPWRLDPSAKTAAMLDRRDSAYLAVKGIDVAAGDEVATWISGALSAHTQFEADDRAHTVSRVGFSDEGDLAVVEHCNHVFSLSGGGTLYVLARKSSGWEIVGSLRLWDS